MPLDKYDVLSKPRDLAFGPELNSYGSAEKPRGAGWLGSGEEDVFAAGGAEAVGTGVEVGV
jgi:hypothetical protein